MAGPQLAPRPTFDCLWCGRSWTTRSADELEGWAKLCPDCLGKAGDNAFLRFRLRDALAARAGAIKRGPGTPEPLEPAGIEGAGPTVPAAPSEPAGPSGSSPLARAASLPLGDVGA